MRDQRFTFLCTQEEKELLASLAIRFHRTQGDLIRQLIREAASAEKDSSQIKGIDSNAHQEKEVNYSAKQRK